MRISVKSWITVKLLSEILHLIISALVGEVPSFLLKSCQLYLYPIGDQTGKVFTFLQELIPK